MQRPCFNNAEALQDALTTRLLQCLQTGQRGLIRLAMDASDAADIPPWLNAHWADRADRADRISRLLGGEHRVALLTRDELDDSGVFAALGGSLLAGSLVLLLDIDNTAFATHQETSRDPWQRRVSLLIEQFLEDHPAITLDARIVPEVLAQLPELCAVLSARTARQWQADMPQERQPAAHGDAQQYIEQALAQALQHLGLSTPSATDSQLLLTGPRGSGKSTLLARIAQHAREQGLSVHLVAQHASGTQRLLQDVPDLQRRTADRTTVPLGSEALLLIEEASQLSLGELGRLITLAPRVAMACTTAGYELAGRALSIALQELEDASIPTTANLPDATADDAISASAFKPENLRVLTLSHSFRHDADDHLSALLNRLSGTSTQAQRSVPAPLSLKTASVRRFNTTELEQHPAWQEQTWSLLSANHYQSTSKDYRHLLGSPDFQCWLCIADRSVVAAAITVDEPPIDEALHAEVLSGRRRPPGHLLPVLLARTLQTPDALAYRYRRVVRLATARHCRRRGLASQLLAAVQSDASSQGIDAVGASFAARTDSLAFWQQQGFARFHLGTRINPRSGRRSASVLRALAPALQSTLDEAVALHHANRQAATQLLGMTPQDLATRGQCLYDDPQRFDGYDDRQQLTALVQGERSVDDSLAALLALALDPDHPEAAALLAPLHKVLQEKPGADRRRLEKAIRRQAATSLAMPDQAALR